MRLTRAGEYAVRCVLYLARKGQGKLAGKQEIARSCGIPPHFLAKIAQQLARAGIIQIQQGARGGYLLPRPPQTITLLEVIEAIIGEIFLNDCVLHPESCRASASCKVSRIWDKARSQLRETLGAVDFASLLEDEECCIFPVLQPEELITTAEPGEPAG